MRNHKGGNVPIYQDATRCVDDRVSDPLGRMTIEEKVGQMFQIQLVPGANGILDKGNEAEGRLSIETMLRDNLMSHFNLMGDIDDTRTTAEFVNRVQRFAREETRLGIPVSISSDPRHAFTENVGSGFQAGSLSQWPETTGLAALRDPALVRKFAEITREEYIAVGIRVALSPQADVVTEPRWARISGT